MNNCTVSSPWVYILIRTTKNKRHNLLPNTINSINQQDYENVHVLVLVDCYHHENGDNIENEDINLFDSMRYVVSKKEITCGNSAETLFEIRKFFLSKSDSTHDIAILMDDDDAFLTPYYVSSIVNQMVNKQADVCLINFEINDLANNNIISDASLLMYRDLLKFIEKLPKAVDYNNIPYLCRAVSMAWTKCCRRNVIEMFNNSVIQCDIYNCKQGQKRYCDIKTYEDFVDFAILIFKDVKITASTQSTYVYNKHINAITANLTKESFKTQRIGFLRYLEVLVKHASKQHFDTHSRSLMLEFIKFKLHVIMFSILDKRGIDNYSSQEFLNDFNFARLHKEQFVASKEELVEFFDRLPNHTN